MPEIGAVLDQADFAAAIELIRRCDAAIDLAGYRREVMRLVDHVPGHIISYNEVDLAKGTLVADTWPEDVRWDGDYELFARYAHQHPVIANAAATGDVTPRAISDFIESEELHALDLYQQVYSRLEVEDQIAVTLPSTAEMVLGVAISRREIGFSERDRAFLALVAPPLGESFLLARARDRIRLGGGLVGEGWDAIVLTPDDRADSSGNRAEEILRRLCGSGIGHGGTLPEKVAAYLERTRELNRAQPQRVSEVLESDGDGVRITARLVPGATEGENDVLLLEERPDPLAPGRLDALGLSQREGDVVRLLVAGLSNAEIGERLHISPATVKRHLENVYAKLGESNRSALIGRILREGGN